MLLNHGSLLSCDGLLFQAVLAENEERGSSAASWAASSAAEAPIATALGAVVVRIAELRRRKFAIIGERLAVYYAGLTEQAVATSKPSQIASADAFKIW